MCLHAGPGYRACMAHVKQTTIERQGAGAQRASNKRQAEAMAKLEAVLADCMEAGLGARGIGSAVGSWLYHDGSEQGQRIATICAEVDARAAKAGK